jgi:hypothetical protein
MRSERTVRTPIAIDPAFLAAHPEPAVLTLDGSWGVTEQLSEAFHNWSHTL